MNEELKEIKRIVEEIFEVEDINSKRRYRYLIEAKQCFCYLSRKYTNLNLRTIGDFFNQHHATIIHNRTQCINQMSINKPYALLIDKCEAMIFESEIVLPNNNESKLKLAKAKIEFWQNRYDEISLKLGR